MPANQYKSHNAHTIAFSPLHNTPTERMNFSCRINSIGCNPPAFLSSTLVSSVNSEVLNSSKVPDLKRLHFRTGSSKLVHMCNFKHPSPLIHREEVGTYIFTQPGHKRCPVVICKAPWKVSTCFLQLILTTSISKLWRWTGIKENSLYPISHNSDKIKRAREILRFLYWKPR